MKNITDGTFTGTIEIDGEFVMIKGNIKDTIKNHTLRYLAASPVEKRMSFSGSGLPYSSAEMAFENSKNKGDIEAGLDNYINIKIDMPSAFYTGLGTVLVAPTVYIKYNNGIEDVVIDIKIAEPVPYRMLTYPSTHTLPRKNADFYHSILPLPVRTQEQIIRDSQYPSKNIMHSNFWGLKPPV